MSRPRIALLALAAGTLFLTLACVSSPAPEAPVGPLHVVVLHTNDIHGQVLPRPATWIDPENPPPVGGVERLAAYVRSVRSEVETSGGELLVLDGGDWLQGTPEGAVDGGLPFLKLLERVGYDAMCVGNHELDHGAPALERQLSEVALPAVLANVAKPDGTGLTGTRPFKLLERAGLRIAVVGLLTTGTPDITHPSVRTLTFSEPAEALADVRRELEGDVDWVLPVTHLGVRDDRVLADAHPDLPLIVGGHSHTRLPAGEERGATLIVQAGSRATNVGRVDLVFERDPWRVISRGAQLVALEEPLERDGQDTELAQATSELVARSAARMDAVVGTLAQPLARARGPFGASTAGNLITDALRAKSGADVAIHNRGGIRTTLPAGPVTRRDLFELLPFGNHLAVLTLSGAQLEELVKTAVEVGARTGLELSGMRVFVRRGASGATVVRIEVGGEPLDDSASYRLATNSFLAGGGDGYAVLQEAAERADDPVLLRDILEEVCRGTNTVAPATESRYVVLP